MAALYLRGQAYAGLERYREAEETLNTLLEMDRNHAGAMDLLRRIDQKRISSAAGQSS